MKAVNNENPNKNLVKNKTTKKLHHKQELGTPENAGLNENISRNATLHESYIIEKNSKSKNQNKKRKENMFFQALSLIQGRDINDTQLNLSEFSSANVNLSKEEKVANYWNRPVTKDIFKKGNNIIKISNRYNTSVSINLPYNTNYLTENIFLPDIIEVDENENENVEKKLLKSKQQLFPRTQEAVNTKGWTTAITLNQEDKDNKSIKNEVKPFNWEAIDDWDEDQEINVNNYKNWQNVEIESHSKKAKRDKKSNGKKLEEEDNKMWIIDSFVKESIHRKSFCSSDNNNHYSSIISKKSNDIIQTLQEGRRTTTDKKIHQKFYRSQWQTTNKNKGSSWREQDNGNVNENWMKRFNTCDKSKISNSNSDNNNNNNTWIYRSGSKCGGSKEVSVEMEMLDFLSMNANDECEDVNDHNEDDEKTDLNINITAINVNCSNEYNYESHYIESSSKKWKPLMSKEKDITTNKNEFSTPKKNMVEFTILPSSIRTKTKDKCKYILDVSQLSRSLSLNYHPKNNNNNSLSSSKNFQIDEPCPTIFDWTFYTNLLSCLQKETKSPSLYIQSNYITINNHKITIENRAALFDWLMQICEEFAFKRDTFHYTLNYVDRYLSNTKNIKSTKELTLIGITSWCIAAKIEEVQIPKWIEYANSTKNMFTFKDIIQQEPIILQVMRWNIIPVTINTWANWYICQWDLFIETIEEVQTQLKTYYKEEEFMYFKHSDDNSYYNYRKIMQLVDLCRWDYQGLKYNNRYLVAAGIFLIICVNFELKYDFNKLIFTDDLKNTNKVWKEVYYNFVSQSFDIEENDKELAESLRYIGQFKDIKFNYELPLIYQVEENNLENVNYEEFLSYQTYNESDLEFLKGINK